jgi:hypothetical protein
VIDRWSVHDTLMDRALLAAGARRIRIDYFDAAGWAELQVVFSRPGAAPRRAADAAGR